jgi:hypothetical protein
MILYLFSTEPLGERLFLIGEDYLTLGVAVFFTLLSGLRGESLLAFGFLFED